MRIAWEGPKKQICYLSLRDISMGVVRSEAFMTLLPEARLGLAISEEGTAPVDFLAYVFDSE